MEDKFKWIIITLTPITALLNLFLKRHPKVTEKYYSNGINRYGRQILSKASSFLKFSIQTFFFYREREREQNLKLTRMLIK